jgi:hypothetical protein
MKLKSIEVYRDVSDQAPRQYVLEDVYQLTFGFHRKAVHIEIPHGATPEAVCQQLLKVVTRLRDLKDD